MTCLQYKKCRLALKWVTTPLYILHCTLQQSTARMITNQSSGVCNWVFKRELEGNCTGEGRNEGIKQGRMERMGNSKLCVPIVGVCVCPCVRVEPWVYRYCKQLYSKSHLRASCMQVICGDNFESASERTIPVTFRKYLLLFKNQSKVLQWPVQTNYIGSWLPIGCSCTWSTVHWSRSPHSSCR